MVGKNDSGSSSSGGGDDDGEDDPNETGEAEDSGLMARQPMAEQDCEKILGGFCIITLLAIAMTCMVVFLIGVGCVLIPHQPHTAVYNSRGI